MKNVIFTKTQTGWKFKFIIYNYPIGIIRIHEE